MPSIFQLEGPKLDCVACSAGISGASLPWWRLGLFAIVGVGVLGAAIYVLHGSKSKRRLGSPQRIARESVTVEEYARRVEAWNAGEAQPQSLTKLAKAWAGGRDPGKTMRLLREAREARTEGRERLWSRMSRGLR